MKTKILSLFLISQLFLSACGKDNNSTVVEDLGDEQDETREELIIDLKSKENKESNIGEIDELEDGTKKVVRAFYNIDESQESGPFKITVNSVLLSQFKPYEEKVEDYGANNLGLISIELLVENQENKNNNIYPMQGEITTDTGEEVDVHYSMSDQVGGEFPGKIKKEGKVHCFFNGESENISELTYIIEAAHDKNLQALGKDFTFVFKLD